MYTPQADVSNIFKSPEFVPPVLLDKPRFSLDVSGVAGLMGGDDAVSVMAAVHVYGNKRWLGWYNTPGSFQVANRLHSFAKFAPLLGIFCRNRFINSLSKTVPTDPTTLFQLDNCKGPKYRAAHSGTIIEETGHLAALFVKECAAWNAEGTVVPGRKTQPITVTIAELGETPAAEMHPAYNNVSTFFLALVPIAISIGTCVLSAVWEDWYASLLILVGIVASGISCLVLGSADFVFTHPEPAKGSPAGDGILSSDKDIILLIGTESAVNSITRGKFSLRFSSGAHYGLIRWCSVLFFVQCVVQLLLIPQATLFGQIMFLVSLGVSALYNAVLSSSDKEKIHQKLLFERVLENPPLSKYTLGTRTTAVVFILLVLHPQDPTRLLNELLPNDTKVWRAWKAVILERLPHPDDLSFSFDNEVACLDGFTEQEKDLSELLYGDARAGYNGYKEYLRVDAL